MSLIGEYKLGAYVLSRIKKHSLPLVLLIFIGLAPMSGEAGVVVIVNKNLSIDSLTVNQVKKIWLGKLKKMKGKKLRVIDQTTGSTAYEVFYTKVVRKKPRQLKAYWAKVAFTGKGFPPEQLKDDAAVVKWVSSNAGGLGYVDSSAVNGAVKALLTVK